MFKLFSLNSNKIAFMVSIITPNFANFVKLIKIKCCKISVGTISF